MAASLLTSNAETLGGGLESRVSVGVLRAIGVWSSDMMGGGDGLNVGKLTTENAAWCLREMSRLAQVP
jgi:hypothetical protein